MKRSSLGGAQPLVLPGAESLVENTTSSAASFYLLEYEPRNALDAEGAGDLLLDAKDLTFKAHDKGGRTDYFDRPTAACKKFEMHTTTLNPNGKPPTTHAPNGGDVRDNGRRSRAANREEVFKGGSGDIFYIEAELPHAIRNLGKEQCHYFAFQWQ